MKGYLDGRLVNHVWSKFQPDERHQLLDVMEQFDLICAAPSEYRKHDRPALGYTEPESAVASPIFSRNYFVPSLFSPKDVKTEPDLAAWASLDFLRRLQRALYK